MLRVCPSCFGRITTFLGLWLEASWERERAFGGATSALRGRKRREREREGEGRGRGGECGCLHPILHEEDVTDDYSLSRCRTWDVEADRSWTVEQLKAHLKQEHKLEGKKIRLISLGRMLADPSTIVRLPSH